MQGLKTRESNKFIKFFEIVQQEAERESSVFFLEAGDGRDFETKDLEGEDLQGWLIPKNRADEFEKQWKKGQPNEDWDEFFCFAIWKKEEGKIKVKFE